MEQAAQALDDRMREAYELIFEHYVLKPVCKSAAAAAARRSAQAADAAAKAVRAAKKCIAEHKKTKSIAKFFVADEGEAARCHLPTKESRKAQVGDFVFCRDSKKCEWSSGVVTRNRGWIVDSFQLCFPICIELAPHIYYRRHNRSRRLICYHVDALPAAARLPEPPLGARATS